MVFTNRTHKDLKEIKRAKRQSTHSVRERHTQKRQISSTRRAVDAHPLHTPRQNGAFGL